MTTIDKADKGEESGSASPHVKSDSRANQWRLLKVTNSSSTPAVIIAEFRALLNAICGCIDEGCTFRFKIHSICVFSDDESNFVKLGKKFPVFKFVKIEEPFGEDVDVSFLQKITDDEITDLIILNKRLTSRFSPMRFSSEKITLREANILILRRIRERLDVMDEAELILMIGKLSIIFQKIKSIEAITKINDEDI